MALKSPKQGAQLARVRELLDEARTDPYDLNEFFYEGADRPVGRDAEGRTKRSAAPVGPQRAASPPRRQGSMTACPHHAGGCGHGLQTEDWWDWL